MRVFNTKKELKTLLNTVYTKNCTVGMVPTMGALHVGHVSLVNRAIKENNLVVVSIFVNPTQFNNSDDLKKYPKTFKEDIALLKELSEDILVYAPSVNEIYPDTVEPNNYDFDGLDEVMEGEFREDHFNGVGTVVEELLQTVLPQKAYFGEKDFQQLQIIKKLVAIKHLPIDIIGCPIVREASGLAMSSRNERLSKELRNEAAFIYKTLLEVKKKFSKNSINSLIKWAEKEFDGQSKLTLEYLQIASEDTLRPAFRKQKDKKYRAFVAVYADGIRLIDNIALN
ncbi:pantoate--beta-alanine ligase [Spongiimicrobium sp. 3-5]|uniref:pantoate--beta-alanine ligase n=1 Tax=Spongiimicrobium sp. 3-5 TaxID=3332596 RepID=UPI003980D712